MKTDLYTSFLLVTLIVLALGAILATSWLLSDAYTTSYSVTGIVTKVEFQAAGYSHTDITGVYLDNGYCIPVNGKHTFIVGQSYTFQFNNHDKLLHWEKSS